MNGNGDALNYDASYGKSPFSTNPCLSQGESGSELKSPIVCLLSLHMLQELIISLNHLLKLAPECRSHQIQKQHHTSYS